MMSFFAELHLDWLAVAVVAALTGVAGWADLRTGRIPNRLIQWLMAAAAAWLWIVVALSGFVGLDPSLLGPAPATGGTVQGWLLEVAKNGLIAFGIAIALWLGRLWAAGDAKLFPLVVLLLPLRAYQRQYVPLFPGFVVLYNFVIATFVVIVGDLGWRGVLRVRAMAGDRGASFRAGLAKVPGYVRANAADAGRFLLMLLVVMTFIRLVRNFMREGMAVVLPIHDDAVVYVLLFFACHPLIHVMRHKWVLILAVSANITAILVASFTEWLPHLTLKGILTMSLTAAILMIFRMAYDAYQAKIDYVEIEVADLKPKMVLSDPLAMRLRRDKQYFKKQQVELGALLADGLQPEQVPLVQRWIREQAPGEKVQIQKTFPMGACIFLGLLLTLLAGGYVFEVPR